MPNSFVDHMLTFPRKVIYMEYFRYRIMAKMAESDNFKKFSYPDV